MSCFYIKLESHLFGKADEALHYDVYALFLGIIEYLMIRSINPTIQVAYLKSACNCLHS